MVCGATILLEMRAAVTAELGYTCSGGLAPSKLLAKLGSAMHKPNQQTLIVQEIVPVLLAPMPVARLKGLGGDFGKKVMEDLGCSTIGEVVQTPLASLRALYGDADADWLFKLVRGVDGDTVEDRRLAKSVSCGKTFYGHNNLRSMEQVHTWLRQLAGELAERLRKDADLHARIPQLLTVSFQAMGLGGQQQNVSRSAPLRLSIEQLLVEVEVGAGSSDAVGAATATGGAVQESLAEQGLSLVRRWHNQQVDETPHLSAANNALCLTTLYLTAGNFLEIKQKSRMTSFFTKADPALVAVSMSVAGAGAGACCTAPNASSPSKPQRLPDGAASQSSSSSTSATSFFTQRTLPVSQQQHFNNTQDVDGPTLKRKEIGNSEGRGGKGEEKGGGGENGGRGVAAALGTSGLDPAHVDSAVLAELPVEIRNEIMAGMAAAAATGKKVRSSTSSAAPSSTVRKIENYFQRGSIAATAQLPPPASSVCSASPARKRTLDRFFKTKKA